MGAALLGLLAAVSCRGLTGLDELRFDPAGDDATGTNSTSASGGWGGSGANDGSFDIDSTTLTVVGDNDLFVAKVDPNGD